MGNIAIVTDSNSGITQAAARELGVRVLPMPFYINEELFLRTLPSPRRPSTSVWRRTPTSPPPSPPPGT